MRDKSRIGNLFYSNKSSLEGQVKSLKSYSTSINQVLKPESCFTPVYQAFKDKSPACMKGRVCGNLATGLPSCLLTTNKMTSPMAGTWQFDFYWNNRYTFYSKFTIYRESVTRRIFLMAYKVKQYFLYMRWKIFLSLLPRKSIAKFLFSSLKILTNFNYPSSKPSSKSLLRHSEIRLFL